MSFRYLMQHKYYLGLRTQNDKSLLNRIVNSNLLITLITIIIITGHLLKRDLIATDIVKNQMNVLMKEEIERGRETEKEVEIETELKLKIDPENEEI